MKAPNDSLQRFCRGQKGWLEDNDKCLVQVLPLSGSRDYIFLLNNIWPCSLSGSGQGWPRSEYATVICCWGFDPDFRHQIWNKTCVFAPITVCRGAGTLRGGMGAIIRWWNLWKRKGSAATFTQSVTTRLFIRAADKCKAVSCQHKTCRNVW